MAYLWFFIIAFAFSCLTACSSVPNNKEYKSVDTESTSCLNSPGGRAGYCGVK